MNKTLKKVSLMFLAALYTMMPAVQILAASTDIIDTDRTATLTIHKYDSSAAADAGVDIEGFGFKGNGQKDIDAESILKNYSISGVEFTYSKVGDIHTDSDKNTVQVLYDVPEKLETALTLTDPNQNQNHTYTSDELNKALSDTLNSNTAGKNILEEYVFENNGTAMDLTDENGITSETGLELGLYLIVETKVPANVDTTVDPFFISLPMTDREGDSWFYDVDVYPKNQTSVANLDKLVKESDEEDAVYTDTVSASEGDTLNYIIVSRLPRITSTATYLKKYDFADTMDTGFTYNKDVVINFYDNEEDARTNNIGAAVKTWDAAGDQFEVSYPDMNDAMKHMMISPTVKGLEEINSTYSEQWLVVAYSCTVNSDNTPILGDSGNKNTVDLEWKRTIDIEDDFGDRLTDWTKVYTFGLNIQKNFSDDAGNAAEVQFVLKNETDGYWMTARSDTDTQGVYYVTDSEKVTAEDKGTIFSPAQDGKLVINGLEADTYVLTEVATSSGYSLLKEPMVIKISGTVDEITASSTTKYDTELTKTTAIETNGARANANVDNKITNMSSYNYDNDKVSTNAFVDLTILNSHTFQLPQTGGYGTLIFTLTGCGAALAGILILTKKSPKKEA